MSEQFDTAIYHAPIAFEEDHFEAAYFPSAVAFDVVVPLVGSAAAVVVEAVFAAAPAAARAAVAEVSADHLGTDPMQNPPVQHMDLRAGRKSSQEKRQGTKQLNTTS